jgi:ubiquitin-protein ligase E3 C
MSWQPGSTSKVALRGSSKQEITSKQLLEQAKEERKRRKRERDEPRAAIQIQRHWRGHAARAAARAHLQSEWIHKYGSLASQPDASISAEDLVGTILPMALLPLLPPCGPQRTALEYGAQLILPPIHNKNNNNVNTNASAARTCLRGTMSILLKHLSSTSSDPQQGLLGYSNTSDSDSTASLSSLLHRVVTLCCASIGGDIRNIDALTQTAAARVVALLTSAARAQQKSNALGLFESSGEELLVWLSRLPMISLACRRLLDTLEASSSLSSGGGGGGGGGGSASSSSSAQQQQQLQMALGNLLTAQFHVLDAVSLAKSTKEQKQGTGDGGSGSGKNEVSSPLLPIHFFVNNIFTGPELIPRISGTNALKRMLDEATFCQIAECITEQLHTEKKSKKQNSAFSALSLLTNLTKLFVSPRKSDGGSTLASQEVPRRVYASTADALVAALQQENNSNMSSSKSESLVRVFGDGTVALKLQSALELPKFCELYCCLLELTDAAPSASLRLLSALAFGTSDKGKEALLPKLWRYLAVTIGLPLEISAVATKFELPSLPLGIHSVPSSTQQPFLLFCRAMAHYLSTADDVEFYEEQGLFTLAAQRAIAVGLSSLIFRTHIPLSKSPSSSSSSSLTATYTTKSLLNHAPRLLRALFDRDTRRQFCPPALWLGPYTQLVRTGGAEDISGAAVLRALLQVDRSSSTSQDDEDGEGDGTTSSQGIRQRPSSPVAASTSTSSASGLAAVLLSAPQLIPFEERVEVFRGLVALDKHA